MVWLALYGRRLHVLVGLIRLYLALLVPLLMVAPPSTRPPSGARSPSWRPSPPWWPRPCFSGIEGPGRPDRPGASVPHRPAHRPSTPTRPATVSSPPAGRHRQRHHGCRPFGHGHLLLRRGRTAARLPGGRSGRHPLHRRFIDPAQIDERRQTIDSLRTALQPADPEAAAEVPWTATRKDGQKRRCVVRVRAMPAPVPDPSLDDEELHGPSVPRARGGDRPLRRVRRSALPLDRRRRRRGHDVTEREERPADAGASSPCRQK